MVDLVQSLEAIAAALKIYEFVEGRLLKKTAEVAVPSCGLPTPAFYMPDFMKQREILKASLHGYGIEGRQPQFLESKDHPLRGQGSRYI